MSNAEQEQGSHNRRNNRMGLIVGFIIILLVINGVKWYLDEQKKDELQSTIEQNQAELTEAYARLDKMEDQLDEKIREAEGLQLDVEALTKAKEEIEAEKKRIIGQKNYQIRQLDAKLEGYTALLKEKDAEIERLQAVNDVLAEENQDLKVAQNQLKDTLGQVKQNVRQLEQKVELAGKLKAQNVKVMGLNKRDKAREGEFRNRQFDKIQVSFTLAENEVAPITNVKLYMRVIDPDNQVVFDVALGSGTFMLDGQEEFYTAMQEVLYDRSAKDVTFTYDKINDYVTGNYRVELFADDYNIGSGSFKVR